MRLDNYSVLNQEDYPHCSSTFHLQPENSNIPEQFPVPDGEDGQHHNDNDQQHYPSDMPYDEAEQGMMTNNIKRKSHKDDKTGQCITSFVAEDASESVTANSDAGDVKIREVKAKKNEAAPVAVVMAKETTDKQRGGAAGIAMIQDSPSAAEMDDLD